MRKLSRFVTTILSMEILFLVLLPTIGFSDDCSFCQNDHQRICKDECVSMPQNYSKDNCHQDCIRSKCQSSCQAPTPKAAPSKKDEVSKTKDIKTKNSANKKTTIKK